MKRIFALVLAMSLTVLAACSSGSPNPGSGSGSGATSTPVSMTPEERTQRYVDAITNARSAEDNEYNPILSSTDDDMADITFEMLGFSAEDVESFAISVSLMNVRAYGIAVIMPAEGKADTVKAGLQSYMDTQASNFENYLADQYEVAKSARLETLADGTLVMVLCEGQDAVYESISTALQGK